MGSGAGKRVPAETVEVQGKYAKAIVDNNQITIINQANNPILKVEVKKYKNAFSAHNKVDQIVELVDGIRSELFTGDSVQIPYTYSDSINATSDLAKGMETHVLLHPHHGPPERFVLGYEDEGWNYRIRYDSPKRAGILSHSPKKLPRLHHAASKTEVHQQYKEHEQRRQQAFNQAEEAWMLLPGRVQ